MEDWDDDNDIDKYMLDLAIEASIKTYETSHGTNNEAGPSGYKPNKSDEIEENDLQINQVDNVDGYDVVAGKTWIYPINYPQRDYQFNIVKKGLFKNTLVCLPTGLGKTFIAAVIMYNFYRWFPKGKVVFMAPTKPLVAQQIQACFEIMGITQDDMVEMTGAINPTERTLCWKTKRVFFLTPQVMQNDLSRGICMARDVRCLIIDEAHRALGNHAYVVVVKELSKYTRNFRIVALSATPGSDGRAVQQVISNLQIAAVEIRTDESIDITPYTHNRVIEKVVVPLSEEITNVKKAFMQIVTLNVKRLADRGVLWNRNPESLSGFALLKERDRFRQNPPDKLPRQQFSFVESQFALCTSLYHCLELLQMHGLRSFYNFIQGIMDGQKSQPYTRKELCSNQTFLIMFEDLQQKFNIENPQEDVISHPKLEKLREIVLEHFNRYKNKEISNEDSSTRVMIFAQYRDTVEEITKLLNKHNPLVKAMSFVGRANTGSTGKGLSHKVQQEIVGRFRHGHYNTLISTCVGEEGLDIGDVDLIICFDAHKSPVRLVQRMGRTGRKRDGRIVMLITKGKEEQIYNQGQYNKRNINKAIANSNKEYELYQNNPRMIPNEVEPSCHKMLLTAEKFQVKTGKRIDLKSNQITMAKLLKMGDNGFLSLEEISDWNRDFKISSSQVPKLDLSSRMISLSDASDIVNHSTVGKENVKNLSLHNWMVWQTTHQTSFFVSHTWKASILVNTMRYLENKSLEIEIDGKPKAADAIIVLSPSLSNDLEVRDNKMKTEPMEISPVKTVNKKLISDFFQTLPKNLNESASKVTKEMTVIDLTSDEELDATADNTPIVDFFCYPKSVMLNEKNDQNSDLANNDVIFLKNWLKSIFINYSNNLRCDVEIEESTEEELFLNCDMTVSSDENKKIVAPVKIQNVLLNSGQASPIQDKKAVDLEDDLLLHCDMPTNEKQYHIGSSDADDELFIQCDMPSVKKKKVDLSNNVVNSKLNFSYLPGDTLCGITQLLNLVNEDTPKSVVKVNAFEPKNLKDSSNICLSTPTTYLFENASEVVNETKANFNLLLEDCDSDVIPASPPEVSEKPRFLICSSQNNRSLNLSPIQRSVSLPVALQLPELSKEKHWKRRRIQRPETIVKANVYPSHSTPKVLEITDNVNRCFSPSTPKATSKREALNYHSPRTPKTTKTCNEANNYHSFATPKAPELANNSKFCQIREIPVIQIPKSNEDESHESIIFKRKAKSELPICNKKSKIQSGRFFIESQAVADDTDPFETDDDDEFEQCLNDSFVDNAVVNGADESQLAFYLRSVKDFEKPGRAFSTASCSKPPITEDIFSQAVSTDDSDYMEDSFCVGNDQLDFEISPTKIRSNGNMKWKRIKNDVQNSSSTSDETEINETNKSSCIVNSIPQTSKAEDNVKKKNPVNIFVSSKEVAIASTIISSLRFKHNIDIQVRSISDCDYIISNRVGVKRKTVSDVADINAQKKLLATIKNLVAIYEKPFLIIEDDRPMNNAHAKPNLHTIHFDSLLVQISASPVRLLFSYSKEETADVLVNVSESESRKGYSFQGSCEPTSGKENVFKLYCSLPDIGYCSALNFCNNFKNFNDFVNSSLEEKVLKGRITKSKADLVEKYLQYHASSFVYS